MDFSEWSPLRIIIAIVLLLFGGIGIIVRVKERFEKERYKVWLARGSVLYPFPADHERERKAINKAAWRSMGSGLVSANAIVFWIFILICTLSVAVAGYVIGGKDFFSKKWTDYVGWWLAMVLIFGIAFEFIKVEQRINKQEKQISEVNQRLSDLTTEISGLRSVMLQINQNHLDHLDRYHFLGRSEVSDGNLD